MEPLFITIAFSDLVTDKYLSVVHSIKNYIVPTQSGNVFSTMSRRQE